jgi:hypothetical protein
MGNIKILKKILKKWIFPFFSAKIWEILQFNPIQKICSVSFRWGSQCLYETTVLEPTLYSIATHCDIVCSNSALEAKNTENRTKTRKIKSIRKIVKFHHGQIFPIVVPKPIIWLYHPS